jgi:hypothetical protein
MSEVLLLYDNNRPHHHTHFGGRVRLIHTTVLTWFLTWTPLSHWQGATVCQWLQRKVSNFTERVYMLVFKRGERLSTNMETSLKNSNYCSNVVLKLCEIFTCQTCKQHDNKNGRNYEYFLTTPCSFSSCIFSMNEYYYCQFYHYWVY